MISNIVYANRKINVVYVVYQTIIFICIMKWIEICIIFYYIIFKYYNKFDINIIYYIEEIELKEERRKKNGYNE